MPNVWSDRVSNTKFEVVHGSEQNWFCPARRTHGRRLIRPLFGSGSGWAKRNWCKIRTGWLDISGWQQLAWHLWSNQDWFYWFRHAFRIFNQFRKTHQWWRLQQQRLLRFRLRLIALLFWFWNTPVQVAAGGIFLPFPRAMKTFRVRENHGARTW